MANIPLSSLKPGTNAKIIAFSEVTPPQLHRRLCALGFVPGSHVEVVRRAPLGDPTEYAVRSARVSLRQSEAQLILMEGHDE